MTRSRPRYLVWSPDALATPRDGWAGVLAETLAGHAADVGATAADLSPSGFPWDDPGTMHADWPGDRWWRKREPVFASAFADAGVPRRRADALTEAVHDVYRDPDIWTVHPDATDVLDAARERGWEPVLLANAPPDLPDVLADLGLTFARTFVSATTGYELPHPRAWETVYDRVGDARFWAAGTDERRDCEAAWEAGVPVVQVTDGPGGTRGDWDRAASLAEVPELLPA